MALTTRRLEAVVLVVLVAATVVALTWRGGPKREPEPDPAPRSLLDVVPSDAAFVAAVDLPRVRQSDFGAALAASGRELPGLGRIDVICGFDPTERVRSLALAFPTGRGRESELGIVALGDFRADELVRCASSILERRGGTPVVARVGSFTTVRDRAAPGGGEVAVRDGGPVILAGGRYLRDIIDTADGRAPSMRRNMKHRRLREAVERGGTVVATWVAPPRWFEQLAGPDAGASPLSGVRAAALRLDFAPELEARLVVRCIDAAAAQAVAGFLEGIRAREIAPRAREELGLELDGGKLGIVADGDSVLAALRLDVAEAKEAFAKGLARALGPGPGASSDPPVASAPRPPPRPRADGTAR